MQELLRDLNPSQREAVLHIGGPLLVLAGPGSGKTRVLTRRIGYRVLGGVPGRRILALAFTNSAATEMRQRVAALVGAPSEVRIGTFHWAGNALLRRYIDRLERRRDFRVLDTRESRRALSDALRTAGMAGYDLRLMADAVSALKAGVTPDRAVQGSALSAADVLRARAQYETTLLRANAVDIDDLLHLSVRLLTEHPDVCAQARSAFDEVLVDEYQDTNPVQHTLLDLLLPFTRSLVVVGDEDQSIYGWRWADPRGVLTFTERYPDAHVVKLEENYRSTKYVVRTATAVIRHNRARIDKRFHTGRPAGAVPEVFVVDDELQEADVIAEEILALRQRGTPLHEVAVLYRTNAQSRALEDGLVRRTIPYRVYAGHRFYERPEIQCVVRYLRLALDDTDRDAFLQLASDIPGVGPKRLSRLADALPAGGTFGALTEMPADWWPPAARARLAELLWRSQSVHALRTRAVATVVDAAIAAAAEHLRWDGAADPANAAENLEELRAIVREIGPRAATLRGLIDRLALGDGPSQSADSVQLLTLHAAKGREYDVVFMPGMEEGLLPHRRSLHDDDFIEEERRLCYVGMTRARERLYFSYAHTRALGSQTLAAGQSRFIKEMGSSTLRIRAFGRKGTRPRLHTVVKGESVRHTRWGRGTVRAVEGCGRDTMVTIEFEAVGRQRLQLCHAPLSRPEEDGANVFAG